MKTQIENFKMKVTPEQSKVVENICMVVLPCCHKYLFWDGENMSRTANENIFARNRFPELTYAQFMAKYAPFNPNPGDVVCGERGNPYIFKNTREGDDRHFVWSNGKHLSYGGLAGPATRFATQAEREMLAEMLKKDGKRWNANKLQIEQNHSMDTARYMARDDHNPLFPPKQDEVHGELSTVNHVVTLNPAHLAIAFRIFGPYTDSENIAKIVNIVLNRSELFQDMAELDEKFNHPSKG